MSLVARLTELRASAERGVLFTVVDGDASGAKVLVLETESTSARVFPTRRSRSSTSWSVAAATGCVELADGTRVFAEWYGPPPRLVVYGAVDTAESLCQGARMLGWTAIVADARATFLTPERIPSADLLVPKWPAEAFAELALDHQTAVIVLTHDDKFDEPALIAALDTEAFYIGALGSRRNQERRRARLLEAGVPEEKLDRIQGPAGLDIGADTQAETALSMLAEVLAVRAQRGGGPLRDAKQRIHVELS